jgi:hypothetical protein
VDKNSIIRAIAFVLGVLSFFVVSWGAFKAVSNSRTINVQNDAAQTLDSDSSLTLTIDSLEANWNRRVTYQFAVTQDPLYMGRVITNFSYARVGFKESEEDADLRLSATVIDDHPKAIIKCRGKSNVVQVGDKLEDGYIVQNIKEKTVVLTRGGQTVVLQNKALPSVDDISTPVPDINTQQGNAPEQW